MMWIIWNQAIFEGKRRNIFSIVQQITISAQAHSSLTVNSLKKSRVYGKPPCKNFPCGYIDGASNHKIAGVGYCLYLNESHHFEFALGVRYGTNTKAEMLSLWDFLLSSQMTGIPLSHVYGDSQVIINWAKGSTALSPPDLLHWCRETKKLILSFQDLLFTHIYREHNQTADRLSKTALSYPLGIGSFTYFFENQLVSHDIFQLF